MSDSFRLLPTRNGWWITSGNRVSRLPHDAVHDGALSAIARGTLERRQFFRRDRKPFALTVLPSTACNLGCAYCFQNLGPPAGASSAPPRIPRATLSEDGIAQIREFASSRMEHLGFSEIALLLFGGEPLLNPTGCVSLLKALTPIGLVHAEMISNATLLTAEIAAELEAAGLRRIQVTFDGTRESHDRVRVTRRGRATYDTILANIREAAAATSLRWHFRVNVGASNLDGLEDLVEHVASISVAHPSTVHFALLDDVGIGYGDCLGYSDELRERLGGLVMLAIRRGLRVPLMGTSTRDCPFCGTFAGRTGAVVSADGQLFSCWETAGKPDWAVGSMHDGYLPDAVIKDRWVSCDHLARPHGDAAARARFFDRLDALILDETVDAGTCAAGNRSGQ